MHSQYPTYSQTSKGSTQNTPHIVYISYDQMPQNLSQQPMPGYKGNYGHYSIRAPRYKHSAKHSKIFG